jgi:hypothetical protein
MGDLLQPTHLIFILLILLILFGPGRLPKLGEGLRRFHSNLRGEWSAYRGALFMAKGVDPSVGRDVGDMLPDKDAGRSNLWFRCLLAILIGNTLYFASTPLLPTAARMDATSSPGLAGLVDIWFCLIALGVLNLAALFRRRSGPKN